MINQPTTDLRQTAQCHRWEARNGEPTWRDVFRAVWKWLTRPYTEEDKFDASCL